MDNAQKAIMIGVGLFITIIIISVVLLITTTGQDMANDAQGTIGNMNETLQNSLISSYDYKTLTGADVKSLYTQYRNTKDVYLVFESGAHEYYNDEGYRGTVSAVHKASTDDKYYKINSAAAAVAPLEASTISVNIDINSADRYRTYIIYSTDGQNVIGIYADKL